VTCLLKYVANGEVYLVSSNRSEVGCGKTRPETKYRQFCSSSGRVYGALISPSGSKYRTSRASRSRSIDPEMLRSYTAFGSLMRTSRAVPAKTMAFKRFSFWLFSLNAGSDALARSGMKPTAARAWRYSVRRDKTSRNVECDTKC
jgi:hypothetical protein